MPTPSLYPATPRYLPSPMAAAVEIDLLALRYVKAFDYEVLERPSREALALIYEGEDLSEFLLDLLAARIVDLCNPNCPCVFCGWIN